ncbi:hypothetical protein BLS_003312 [Venturia inaequalis]|uniref:Uncharacterized protein n=1 Tax=Venturia inaequalis TaxID=5025 RepID=A0A8H3YVJ6_VENIN|nr:hypothetical protein EG327_010213 [Venturia inaequalis]KAE9973992.1 hypothetical protein BLS_003312 [Venturia inaequalis]
MRFVMPILALLAVQLQALPSPANEISRTSVNEALTLPILSKRLDPEPAPANDLFLGSPGNEAATDPKPLGSESAPANEVPGTSPNEAFSVAKRPIFAGFGQCGGQLALWPRVQYLFFPPRPQRITVDMRMARHSWRGFIHVFDDDTRVETVTVVPLWNDVTGAFGTTVEAWNRTEWPMRLVIIVEVSGVNGLGRYEEHRMNLDLPGGLHYAKTKCMISTFGKDKRVNMYLWIEKLKVSPP